MVAKWLIKSQIDRLCKQYQTTDKSGYFIVEEPQYSNCYEGHKGRNDILTHWMVFDCCKINKCQRIDKPPQYFKLKNKNKNSNTMDNYEAQRRRDHDWEYNQHLPPDSIEESLYRLIKDIHTAVVQQPASSFGYSSVTNSIDLILSKIGEGQRVDDKTVVLLRELSLKIDAIRTDESQIRTLIENQSKMQKGFFDAAIILLYSIESDLKQLNEKLLRG